VGIRREVKTVQVENGRLTVRPFSMTTLNAVFEL
jgi:hypothetical protein